MGRFTGLLGIAIILATAYLFSTNRRAIRPQLLLWGLGLQFVVAFLVLRTGFGWLFQAASTGVNALLEFAETGSQ
ncbi:MAG: NupC/NupG family nucleoside CNT transporter, partial [Bryobacteraceae bacterium]|nr:NupC/NupG family nucleoside CNT transporter [Bryobacteraceae bacterium]